MQAFPILTTTRYAIGCGLLMPQRTAIVTEKFAKAGAILSNSSLSELPFAELLGLAALGDLQAQNAICEQYEQQVRVVARVLLGPQLRSHLDSIDLLQSVHKSLLIGIRDEKFSVASPEKLVALACTIVRRKVARQWRMHRRQLSVRANPSCDRSLITHLLSSISNPHSGPDEIAAYNDELAKLCRSLDNVELAMLELRLQGYTTGEVAEKLGIHPVAIRVRWTRLRQRLDAAKVFSDWL